MTTTLAPPIPVTASGPYKFLDYFEERDKDKFAGRQRDIDEVLARIARARTFVLFGRSGLGKTSLLLAGIFPGLRQQNSLPIYVRTLKAPLRDLFAAVTYEAEGRTCKTMDDLREIVGELSERGPVVLVLDQFEEFFIRFRDRPADRAEFIDGIAEVAHNLDLDLRIVFSLREDFLAELDDFRTTLPELFENEYRLLPLTAFGAREAIVRPLIYFDITYSRSLVTRMIDELSEVGFDPPPAPDLLHRGLPRSRAALRRGSQPRGVGPHEGGWPPTPIADSIDSSSISWSHNNLGRRLLEV